MAGPRARCWTPDIIRPAGSRPRRNGDRRRPIGSTNWRGDRIRIPWYSPRTSRSSFPVRMTSARPATAVARTLYLPVIRRASHRTGWANGLTTSSEPNLRPAFKSSEYSRSHSASRAACTTRASQNEIRARSCNPTAATSSPGVLSTTTHDRYSLTIASARSGGSSWLRGAAHHRRARARRSGTLVPAQGSIRPDSPRPGTKRRPLPLDRGQGAGGLRAAVQARQSFDDQTTTLAGETTSCRVTSCPTDGQQALARSNQALEETRRELEQAKQDLDAQADASQAAADALTRRERELAARSREAVDPAVREATRGHLRNRARSQAHAYRTGGAGGA